MVEHLKSPAAYVFGPWSLSFQLMGSVGLWHYIILSQMVLTQSQLPTEPNTNIAETFLRKSASSSHQTWQILTMDKEKQSCKYFVSMVLMRGVKS